MATTIQASFSQMKTWLEITGLQSETVSTRQKNVRAAIANDLTVLDTFLTGSYSRNTLIAPLKDADIDIFAVLDSSYYHKYNGQNGGPGALLDLVKRTIRKTYSSTPDISRNGQAVTIRFTDFMIDVVPAFRRQGGGYLIPNSVRRSWISTDPRKHIEILVNANKAHNGDLVPLIKMIKCWNRNINWYFQSFHLEVVMMSILSNVRITDFPSGVRYVFDKARDAVKTSNPDPAGYGGDVGAYLDRSSPSEAVGKFQLAYERALKAEEFAKRGNIQEAVGVWRLIFGDYFPAYG